MQPTAPKILLKHRKSFPVLVLFFLSNLIFCVLYARFLLGEAVYMYADIGNDSLSSSYPLLVLLSRLFHEGGFTSYALTDGLGTDITSLFLQFINPVKLLMIVFPTAKLPQAIMISTWIQVNLLTLFGWIFFSSLFRYKDSREATCEVSSAAASVIASLVWTFTAYVVLWGQNYSFLTTIVMFTMIMALIQLYLCDRTPAAWLWFMPAVAIFLISNYYFLFMTAEFAVIYVILYTIFTKTPLKTFIKKVLTLAGMAIIGAVMGFVSLMPIIGNFLASNRVDRLATDNAASGAITALYDKRTLLTFVGRLFSANTFGPGSGYTAAANYYEVAVLSTSILFVFAIIYLILTKKTALKALVLTLLSVGLLITPKVSAVLNMNASTQRWTFMLCFAECLAIGFFIRTVLEDASRKRLTATLLIAPLVSALCLLLVFLGKKQGLYDLSPKPIAFCMMFFGLYEILLLITLRFKSKRVIVGGLLLIVTSELIVSNYMTINDRMYLTDEAFHHAFYNDGSAAITDRLQEEDPALYRIENDRQTDPALYGFTATADKMFANEGMVNNYNGLSVYTSTLPASLTTYGKTYASEEGVSNFFIIDFCDYYLFTLLGGRYVIGTNLDTFVSAADTNLYTIIEQDNDNTVLSNNNALPFGYLYETMLETDDASQLSALEKMTAVTQACFLTDGHKSLEQETDTQGTNSRETDSHETDSRETDDKTDNRESAILDMPRYDISALKETVDDARFEIANLISNTNDCTVSYDDNLLTITATGDDPYIIAHMPTYDTSKSLILSLSTANPMPAVIQLFCATKDYDTFGAPLCRDHYFSDASKEFVMTMPESLTDLRIDIMPGKTVTFDLASLHVTDMTKSFASLSQTDIRDISFESRGTTASYQATVTAENGGVLCVPLPFSRNWHAEIDGVDSTVYNINGGLLGTVMPSGTHSVTLTYVVPHFNTALLVSLLGVIIFIFIYGAALKRMKKAS